MAKKKKQTLQSLRERLQVLADEANRKASQLDPNTNNAYSDALRSLSENRKRQVKKTGELFKGNIRNLKDIQKEFARIDAFNANWKSTPEGEEFYRQERQAYYKGAFGGQWLKQGGEMYDTNRINKEFAERAFQLYDRLVEEYQSEDRAQMLWQKDTKITYGSENMIIAIYDMLIQGQSDFDVMMFAREKMSQNYLEMQAQQFKTQMSDDYEPLSNYKDFVRREKIRNDYIRGLNW